jgi:hypothetical protein
LAHANQFTAGQTVCAAFGKRDYGMVQFLPKMSEIEHYKSVCNRECRQREITYPVRA